MEDDLTTAALRMALASRSVGPGRVHHSGRGWLHAGNEYTDLLKQHGIAFYPTGAGAPASVFAGTPFTLETIKYVAVQDRGRVNTELR
jgi:hypothetical protein